MKKNKPTDNKKQNIQTDNFENDLVELMCNIKGKFKFKSLGDRFDSIAHYLMNYLCLVVGKQPYKIVECEIYYFDKDNHPDPYVHKSPEQLKACSWYFNGFGLDITFGDKSKNIYAGLLIRGIRPIDEVRYINGPSTVLLEVFNQMGNITDEKNTFFITRLLNDDINELDPISTKRIGLTKKTTDKLNFLEKPYRYIIEPVLEHKFANKLQIITKLLKDGDITKEQAKKCIGYNIK